MTPTLEQVVTERRADILVQIDNLNALKAELISPSSVIPLGADEDRGEVIANVILSLRHLEDARMRLGLVFQAIEGGKKINPR